MTERERLIELLLKSDPLHERDLDDDLCDGEVEAIADCLLANGVIVLPCKVGDMLYDIYDAVSNGGGNIVEIKVPEIHINLDRRNKPWLIVSNYYFAFEDFGKTVFLTREEAEKALAERSGK